MLEFVFNKKELMELIDGPAADPKSTNVVIKLAFSGRKGDFTARVTANCEAVDDKGNPISSAREIDGCPRPPGCG